MAAAREGSTPRHGFIPALDGLRGVAIALVLVHHVRAVFVPSLDRTVLPGGFLGVDMFFVLSGFLITGLLLEEHRRGGIGLGGFYRRRMMRLLPALFVVLAAHTVYAAFVGTPRNVEQGAITSIAFYYSNWRHTLAVPEGLGQMWSLAVEEQFYLVWPVFLIGLLGLTRGHVNRIALIVSVAIVVIVAYRAWKWQQGTHWLWLYMRTDSRADALLIGALLALLLSRIATQRPPIGGRDWRPTAGWIASAFLVFCLCFAQFDRAPLYLGGFTAVAVASAFLIVASLPGSSWRGARLFEWRPLCVLGIVSYGLYLWQLPVFFGVRHYATDWPTAVQAVVAVSLTALATCLSWFVIERPFLRWKSRLDHDQTAQPSTVSVDPASAVPLPGRAVGG